MDTGHMVACVRRYVDALSSHDISVMEDLFDKDAAVEDPVGSEPRVGMDAIRKLYQDGFSSGIKAELTGSIRCAGNAAAFPFSVMINSGDSKMKIEVIDIFQFDEKGKILSMKAYWGPDNCAFV